MATISFVDFILELRLRVMANLDAVSLIQCASTCKSLYETLQNSSELECIIQLHLEGLNDERTPDMASADLLEYLRRRRQLQESFEWSNYESIIIHRPHTEEKGVNPREHILKLVPWNTASSNLSAMQVGMMALNVPSNFFAIDSSQDVLVWLDGEEPIINDPQNIQDPPNIPKIHVRTLSTDIPHPMARNHILEFYDPFDKAEFSNLEHVTMQIAQDTLAFFVHLPGRDPRLIVWNWVSSDLIYDSGYEPASQGTPDGTFWPQADFTLLSPTTYLVTSPLDSGCIKLYTLVLQTPHRGHALPISVSRERFGQTTHVVTLHLPLLKSGNYIQRLTAEAGPNEKQAPPHKPVKQKDDDRLHMFSACYMRDTSDRATVLFVHQRVLMGYLSRSAKTSAGMVDLVKDVQILDISWMEWGPQNSRVIETMEELDCGSGQRALLRTHESMGQELTFVEVLDFSLAALLAHGPGTSAYSPASNGSTGDGDIALLADPGREKIWRYSASTKLSSSRFVEDVETYLPFVSVTLSLKDRYHYYVLHEDGIASICNTATGALSIFGAYTYNPEIDKKFEA